MIERATASVVEVEDQEDRQGGEERAVCAAEQRVPLQRQMAPKGRVSETKGERGKRTDRDRERKNRERGRREDRDEEALFS